MVKQISDNEIYLLIKYIKSVLWRVVKCLSYIEEARCLKVNLTGCFALLWNAVILKFLEQPICTVAMLKRRRADFRIIEFLQYVL